MFFNDSTKVLEVFRDGLTEFEKKDTKKSDAYRKSINPESPGP